MRKRAGFWDLREIMGQKYSEYATHWTHWKRPSWIILLFYRDCWLASQAMVKPRGVRTRSLIGWFSDRAAAKWTGNQLNLVHYLVHLEISVMIEISLFWPEFRCFFPFFRRFKQDFPRIFFPEDLWIFRKIRNSGKIRKSGISAIEPTTIWRWMINPTSNAPIIYINFLSIWI